MKCIAENPSPKLIKKANTESDNNSNLEQNEVYIHFFIHSFID